MNAIEVRDLFKSYNSLTAVDGISFEVGYGELFGFLGPNGAGKTTTINILCTLLKPTSGEAYVAGSEVSREPDRIRKRIGLVFQETTLDNELTTFENLLFHAYLYGLERNTAVRRIDELLSIVGLRNKRRELVKHLSGGMKRRLEVIRGLLHGPGVLFLDEPTTGLDPQTRAGVWGFIKDMRKREGTTIFVTTHYMDEASDFDRIAIIDHGKIIAIGNPHKLINEMSKTTVTFVTGDDDTARQLLSYGMSRVDGGKYQIRIEEPGDFMKRMLNLSGLKIDEFAINQPELEDLYISLTGTEIRDERIEHPVRKRGHGS
ncbi:MAG: ATP-binding cassette domain-containing protein [Deltaproteobacteria bacterium]|nr:ATP-binding cassette domain-containing protein [Deltaproteobacteria bacterium]MCL5277180.1 ATP-binding cassette domain-containing protein [Deltaproteobacteria bacterium]